MTAQLTPRLDLIGLVVADMSASLSFYRRLGLDLPAESDGEPHVEVTLAGGLRLAFDTLEKFGKGEEIPQNIVISDDEYDTTNAQQKLNNAY